MNPELQTILIFEPLAGGHRANFIRWLTDAAPAYPECRFVFFAADDVQEPLAHRIASAGRWKKQRLLYQLFEEACKTVRPDHVLILELTHLELPLALFGSPVPLSAILFVQYPELPYSLKFFSKHWKTRLLLWRAPVKNLFLLNGEHSCRWLADHFGKEVRFIPLSDPAPEGSADPDFSMRQHFEIEGERQIFLFFGAISPRKGADVLLDALTRIKPAVAARSAFVFCGAVEPLYREAFVRDCERLRSVRPDLELRLEDRFISDEQMMSMFEQSDLILMPYTRPEYSSGILALAAHAGKPVLGSPGGLLGRLICENGLGLAAELTPELFERPVTSNEELCRKFVAQNTIENFTQPILNAVCHEG